VYERAGGLTKANPRVACEVMAGHGRVDVQIETSLGRLDLRADDVDALIHRLFGERVEGHVLIAPQDPHLSDNQTRGLRCGDNGIFKGCPPTEEQRVLTAIAASIYERWPYDGKYIIGRYRHKGNIEPSEDDDRSLALTVCQSHANEDDILDWWHRFGNDHLWDLQVSKTFCFGRTKDDKKRYISLTKVNPLGPWTGGIDVDCGCTNRKLGSDMGDGVTGGGLMGKDLSKADVSVNIVCYLKAVASGQVVTACCSIGDEEVTFVYHAPSAALGDAGASLAPHSLARGFTYPDGYRETERFADIVEQARLYILTDCGGSFEKFAECGLVRPLAQDV
jgi:S-adenosylmethionine synthetase